MLEVAIFLNAKCHQKKTAVAFGRNRCLTEFLTGLVLTHLHKTEINVLAVHRLMAMHCDQIFSGTQRGLTATVQWHHFVGG